MDSNDERHNGTVAIAKLTITHRRADLPPGRQSRRIVPMKPTTTLMLLAVALLGACDRPAPQETGPVADLLLVNADVVTVDEALPRAEAVAIKDDLILDVGTSEEMSKHRGEHTEVIDLQGQTVIPGFIEGHGHYTSFGGSLMILDFRYAKSFAEIVSRLQGRGRHAGR